VSRRVALAVQARFFCGQLTFAASLALEGWKIPLVHSHRRRSNPGQDLAEVARGRARPGSHQSLFSVGRGARRSRFDIIDRSCDASARPVDHTRNIILATALNAFIHVQETYHGPAARVTVGAELRLPRTQGANAGTHCQGGDRTMHSSLNPATSPDIIDGGEMGALMRAFDWVLRPRLTSARQSYGPAKPGCARSSRRATNING
jgi:hypothetical protein